MIYLDTHVVAWLYAGLLEKFNQSIRSTLNENEIRISPIVRLELQYLFEIQRLREPAEVIIADLSDRIGIIICDKDFNTVINRAITISWTRDPFDRVIVAQAGLNDHVLITKDKNIIANYPHARW